jgi:uncharacterized protein YbjT (DUF2867 family)
MATVLVTGPAGALGSALLPRLVARGHQVRALVHATSIDGADIHVIHGDVRTGAGLLEAFAGVDTVIHTATSPFRSAKATEIEGIGHVIEAARSVNAHLVYPSIVGVDDIGGTYYRAKREAERMVESSQRWTIQRATQFHPILDRMLGHRIFPVTSNLAFQPLDVGDFADHIVELVDGGAVGYAEGFGGPEVLTVRAMVATREAVTNRRTMLIPIPPIGPLRALEAGHQLCPDHARGTVTWERWLREHAMSARSAS